MGNNLQSGFELIGKVFGRRASDVLMHLAFVVLGAIATYLPIIGYFGLSIMTRRMFAVGDSLDGFDLFSGSVLPALSSGVIGVFLLAIAIGILVASFTQSFVISSVRLAYEESTLRLHDTISQASSNWGRILGCNLLTALALLIAYIAMSAFFLLVAPLILIGGSGIAFLSILLAPPLLLVFMYFMLPMIYLAPIDVVVRKTTVVDAFSNSITRSKPFRAKLFAVVLVLLIFQIGFLVIFLLAKASLLASIIMIPAEFITYCIIFPIYLDYSKQFEAATSTELAKDQIVAHEDEPPGL